MPYQIIYSKCYLSAGKCIHKYYAAEWSSRNGKTENINVKTKKCNTCLYRLFINHFLLIIIITHSPLYIISMYILYLFSNKIINSIVTCTLMLLEYGYGCLVLCLVLSFSYNVSVPHEMDSLATVRGR